MALERLRVNVAKVLGTNYTVTSLRVSDYNPNIDSTVTLTVTVKDVYNRPVVGDEVAVTASEGNFTKLNGSGITAASTVTGTTDSNGEFTLTYACSEWGLVTFSANKTSTQVNVTGWREITAGTGRLWVNDETKTAVFHFTRTGAITKEIIHANAIPSGYRPKGFVRMIAHNAYITVIKLVVESDGTVRLISSNYGSTSLSIDCQITYAYGVQ